MRSSVLILLIGLCYLTEQSEADCAADARNPNSQLMQCAQNLTMAMASMNPNDLSSMCKGNVKKYMTCMINIIKGCPQLDQSGMLASIQPAIQQYEMSCKKDQSGANCAAAMGNPQSEFMQCINGLGMAAQNRNPDDPTALCTGDFRKYMTCLTNNLQKCPQLAGNAMYASIKPMIDNFEKKCNALPAISCPGFTACHEKVSSLSRGMEMGPSGNSTPFSLTPVIVHSLCSVFKVQMKCIDDFRSTCPDVVQSAENNLADSLAMDPTVKLTLEDVKKIVKNECPKIPADFAGNKCVREKLEGQGFVSCISRIKQMSAKAPKDEQCRFYFDGKACIEGNIGRPCGAQNAKVIVDTAYLVIHDLPNNCEMPVDKSENMNDRMVDDAPPGGGCSRAQFTLAIFFMFFLAVLVHKL